MNRRDLLKALGALPVIGSLEACMHGHSNPTPSTRIHSLQILLEGPFAVVLEKQSHRLIAFVPRPDPARKDLEHYFVFNDPASYKQPEEKSKGYRFELSGEGLHRYSNQNEEAYINPGFSDFSAETQKWTIPPSLVVLDLPIPRSINFSGRPLSVRFGKKALKPTGLMPTNFILEYRVDEEEKVRLKCNQPEMHCEPSPHCPPGIRRFFFGAGPVIQDPKTREQHAVDFFNFMLARSFPELREKYELVYIEPSDYPEPGGSGSSSGSTRPTSFRPEAEASPKLISAVMNPGSPVARLLPVASLVDCQIGGLLVGTNTGPTG
jgi:hypothetical protein